MPSSDSSQSERRVEVIARVLYRHWMEADYDEFPWDDENEPSSETVEEARELAEKVEQAIAGDYQADDRRFERAVDRAARERLQTLVRSLDG